MPDTPVTRPITLDEFRRAADAFHADVVSLREQHVTPLGGVLGLIHAEVEQLGSLCVATITMTPNTKPSIVAQLQQLLLYVETAGNTPQ